MADVFSTSFFYDTRFSMNFKMSFWFDISDTLPDGLMMVCVGVWVVRMGFILIGGGGVLGSYCNVIYFCCKGSNNVNSFVTAGEL